MFETVKMIKKNDPAAKSCLHVILFSPGLHAIATYRFAHILTKLKIPIIPELIMIGTRILTGIEIHPSAIIGKNFFIDHGMGVVIGETTEIGDNVTIYQGVTLGGNGKEKGKRHPTVGSDVVIGAGAKILGSFTVGSNVNIGANAVVLSDVSDDSTVVGIPGRVVRMNGEKVRESIISLDHIHLPDPIMKKLKTVENEINLVIEEMGTCRENCVIKKDRMTKLKKVLNKNIKGEEE